MPSCFRKFYPQPSAQLKGGLLPGQTRPDGGGNTAGRGCTGVGPALCLGPAPYVAGAQWDSWWPRFESGVGSDSGIPGWEALGGPFVMSALCLPPSTAPPYPTSGLSSQSREAAKVGDGFPLCQARHGPRPGPRILHEEARGLRESG